MSARDPWAIQRWAYETRTGSVVRKSVLMALAVMADTTSCRCEARQSTIAQWVETDERTVRRHLAELERIPLLARRHQYRRDGKRFADEFLLLTPWVTAWPDGAVLPDRTPGSTTGQETPPLPGAEVPTTGHQRPDRRPPLKNDQGTTTPLTPLPGGNGNQDLDSQEAGDLQRAGELWDQVLADIAPTIESGGGQTGHLRSLSPVRHHGDTIVLTGAAASWCRERFGTLVAASAGRVGVVIEFQPAAAARQAASRRQRQSRRRAA